MNECTRIYFEIELIKLGIKARYVRYFLKFLIRNEIYQQYIQNYHCQRQDKLKGIVNHKIHVQSIIDYTLLWSETYEGVDFWGHMNTLWIDECKSLNITERYPV